MFHRYPMIVLTVLAGVLFAAPAQAAELALCSLPQKDALSSPECVRWYFACSLRGLKQNPNPPPEYAALTYAQKMALLVELTFAQAETSCEHFDYEEAGAALSAHLRSLETP